MRPTSRRHREHRFEKSRRNTLPGWRSSGNGTATSNRRRSASATRVSRLRVQDGGLNSGGWLRRPVPGPNRSVHPAQRYACPRPSRIESDHPGVTIRDVVAPSGVRRRAMVWLIIPLLAMTMFSSPTHAQESSGAEAAHHGDYRLDDGSVVFFSRHRRLARYRDGDRVVFLARRPSGVFASRRDDTVKMLDGGKRLRVEFPKGRSRLAERVELYREEEVRFGNRSVTLAGTLLLPPGPGPHPALVFAEGAGRTTRHGFGRIFADHFARHGVAALIYDKRGAGESTGSYGSVVRDYGAMADDLLAGVRLLKARPDIDAGRIGVRGTSEGGWVVALAAARSPDISFVVGISAPAKPAPNGVWEMQNKLRDAGVDADALKTVALASTQAMSLVRLLGLLPECCRHASFPVAEWETVRQPVLLVYGELDKQVPPARSALTITGALRRGGNDRYLVRAFAGANHAIALARTGFESEMRSAPGLRFAPGYLDTMTEWVRARAADEPPPVDHGWVPNSVERLRDIDHPPWHASPTVQLGLWTVLLAVFSATCALPLLRRLLRRPRTQPQQDPAVTRARRLAVAVSAAHLAVVVGMVVVLAQFAAGQPLPVLWAALRALAAGAALLAVPLVGMTALAWRRPWAPPARLHHATVTVAAAGFVPLLVYWRLLV